VEVTINARNGELTDSVKETIEAKVSKLPRFFDRTTAFQVIADLKHDEPKLEIILSAEGASDFFASDNGTNVISALDTTIAKMEQQLRKYKEKITEHRDRH
jgi:putative sigma-54 modulation protein